MTNDSSSPPIAISFQEFRDGEIVDFFANESRTFRPDNVGNNFGRSRLVGAPHLPGKQNGTAAFRASFQRNEESEKSNIDHRTTILREETVATIPLPTEILDAPSDVLAATIHEPPKKKKDIRSEPSFAKPSRPLGSVMNGGALKPKQAAAVIDDPLKKLGETVTKKKTPTHSRPILVVRREPVETPSQPVSIEAVPPPEETLPARLRETDEKLGRLIETWPRLSDRLKETIAALIEVGEKGKE